MASEGERIMREIKFRAWNETTKKMMDWEELKEDMIETLHVFENGLADVPPVMQYTGLKDSTKWDDLTKEEQRAWISSGNNKSNWNGFEIYEGDVLAVANWANRVYWDNDLVRWRTEYAGGLCDLSEVLEGNIPNNIKVIGNIYKNPEL